MKVMLLLLFMFQGAHSAADPSQCPELFKVYSLSPNYNETIAHAVHSLTQQDLLKIEPEAPYPNTIPVVNPQLRSTMDTERVLIGTPNEFLGSDFYGATMNTIDKILSQVSVTDAESNWIPMGRIIHRFHMEDVWQAVTPSYHHIKKLLNSEKSEGLGRVDDLCACLKDIKTNGIYDAVDLAAKYYNSNAILFSLTNGPEKPFKGPADWNVYKNHMLQYYSNASHYDVAVFLYCHLN